MKLSPIAIVLLVIVGFFAVCGIGFFSSYVSMHNYGNATEAQLDSQYQNSQNLYATYTNKVLEISQLPAMYRDDLIKVVTASMQGRYGKEGSKATWQFLTEHNPTLDSTLYNKIANVIDAGRTEFANSQTLILDTRRSYKTELGSFWNGFMLRLAGYPKVDLSKYDPVINDKTEQAFKTKKDEPVQLR